MTAKCEQDGTVCSQATVHFMIAFVLHPVCTLVSMLFALAYISHSIQQIPIV